MRHNNHIKARNCVDEDIVINNGSHQMQNLYLVLCSKYSVNKWLVLPLDIRLYFLLTAIT